jgi:hypothetical protein
MVDKCTRNAHEARELAAAANEEAHRREEDRLLELWWGLGLRWLVETPRRRWKRQRRRQRQQQRWRRRQLKLVQRVPYPIVDD